MSFLTLFLLSILLCILIYLTKEIYQVIIVIKNVRQLPGPPSKNLLWGNVHQLRGTEENLFKTARRWGLKYYPNYQTHAAYYFAAANFLNPYDFEIILGSNIHINKSIIYKIAESWLGTGLLTSGGTKWQKRRKILTPSFHFKILLDFIEIFNEETDKLVEIFKKECNGIIDVTKYIDGFTLNTIGETAMGVKFDEEGFKAQAYKDAVKKISLIYNYRLLKPWLLNNFLYFFDSNYFREQRYLKILHEFTRNVIKKRIENFKPINIEENSYSKRKRLAMLDLLLTAKIEEDSIDDEGIREEVDTFMFEGHDTTAAAICFALLMIACHRDVQDRIVEEMREIFRDSTKRDYKALQELQYLERCIKEVLRLYPSVPFISRVLGKDMVTHNGYLLKAGTVINLHIYDLHHNPDVYPDPERFDPDRFLPENCQKRHNFAYVPFSAGPRNCIGQKFALLEIKAVLCGILSEFILEPIDTPSSIVMLCQVVLRTQNGIRVKFVPRDSKIIKE